MSRLGRSQPFKPLIQGAWLGPTVTPPVIPPAGAIDALGKARFLYDDLSADVSQFASSSIRDGVVGLAVKTGSGSAQCVAGGAYTGAMDRQYRVEIDNVAPGKEVGQATFRWRDGSITGWNATGAQTSINPTALTNGVTVRFVSGSGDDFAITDRWDFTAACFFGYAQLIDRDRDSAFRTKWLGDPEWITRNLGASQLVRACVIADHTLTSGATITLRANTSNDWDSPPYSLSIPWRSGLIVVYLNETYQWWRLEITDAANPDGYIEISSWFLGDYLELSKNVSRQISADHVVTETIIKTDAGARRNLLQSRQEEFRVSYRMLSDADMALFDALEVAVHDAANLRSLPIWFHLDSSDTGATCTLVMLPSRIGKTSPSLQRWNMDLTLTGIPRTVR